MSERTELAGQYGTTFASNLVCVPLRRYAGWCDVVDNREMNGVHISLLIITFQCFKWGGGGAACFSECRSWNRQSRGRGVVGLNKLDDVWTGG